MQRFPRLPSFLLLPPVLLLGSLVAHAQEVTVKPAASPSDISEFLRPPGSDPYAPLPDWSALPPWRQTSFFDVKAEGTFFIFVVDCSGSMDDGARLIRAKHELRRTISRLQFPQRFLIIFYNDKAWPMPGDLVNSADTESKNLAYRWLARVDAEGETDPRTAMNLALSLRPNAVFLLSDGDYPTGCVESIALKNKTRIPIHCIDLAPGAVGDDLKLIAKQSGGQYAARP
ncbi:MAG TPA: VWA domain-containing protein [Isosphaeraceae bacterium]|nr:VWA domain-containing protein [Isosphaeraceae bacterium]